MKKLTKWILTLTGGAAIVALAIGVMAFSLTSNASAQSATVQNTGFGGFGFRGGPGFPGNPGATQEALANALGITVAQLQTAEQQASDNAIQQAVTQGLITQDQANNMILRGYGFRGGFEERGFGANSGIDYNQLLATALGVTTEKLQSAQQAALKSVLDQAVANGTLTQDQANLIEAEQALQSYINPNDILAQALGITTDQLQTYRQQGMTLSQILSTTGKTAIDVRNAEQAAYQAAVQQAVSNGAITQAQADQVLASGFPGIGGGFEFGPGGFGGRGGRGHGGFEYFGGGSQNTTPSTPSTPAPTTQPSSKSGA